VRTLCSLLVVATACSFDPQTLEVQPDAQASASGSSGSSQPPTTIDAPSMTQLAACHSQLPGVVVCLDFEDASLDPTVRDSSGEGHDGTASNVVAMPRASQQAAMVSNSSSIVVPASASFDLGDAFSIEMWFDPASTDEDNTIITHSDDFGIDFAQSTGCFNGDDETWGPNALSPGWHHVACTYDGRTLTAYVDGAIVACMTTSPRTVSSDPLQISDHVVGGIDDIHLYDRALAPAEIQLMAGIVSDDVTCPIAGSPQG
jgi:Concanavalin A-like lectin/glucanases superfamily